MSGFSFGMPQTTASSGFSFGVSNTQAPTQQQPAPSFNFGTASTTTAPVLAPATTSGLSFGVSAPPYGAQTTTATPLSFGAGTATTKYVTIIRKMLSNPF